MNLDELDTIDENGLLLGAIRLEVEAAPGAGGGNGLQLLPDPVNRRLLVLHGDGSRFGTVIIEAAGWLADLLGRGQIRLEARLEEEPSLFQERTTLTVQCFLLPAGAGILRPNRNPGDGAQAFHEVVRNAFVRARHYREAAAIEALHVQLRSAATAETPPPTRLLLSLLPGMAEERRRKERRASEREGIRAYLDRVEVGEALTWGGLSLYPLTAPNGHEPAYVTLAEATALGRTRIEEVSASGSVPNLRVIHQGDKPLLLPEGEILVGAKQNRTVNTTVLVAANSEFILSVSCVERGRWRHVSPEFTPGSFSPAKLRARKTRSVHENLRRAGRRESDQGAVWDSVEEELVSLQAESETSSITDGIDRARGRLEDCRRVLQVPPDATGVLFTRGHRLLGMDLFDCNRTLQHYWERLADSYFLAALEPGTGLKPAEESLGRAFLRQVAASVRPTNRHECAGTELEVEAPGITGSGIWYAGVTCHLSAFPVE